LLRRIDQLEEHVIDLFEQLLQRRH
jgi:hypothetical protein